MCAHNEAERRIHAQQTGRFGAALRDQLFEFGEVVEDARAIRQINLTLRRQTHAPCGAVHEPHAEALFEMREPLADGWRRDAEFARGRGEVTVACHQREQIQVGKAIHRFVPKS